MASFFKKYLRDVVYLCVIAGLVGWMIYTPGKQLDKQWRMHLESTLDQAHSANERFADQTLQSIEDQVTTYIDYTNQKFSVNAQKIMQLTKKLHSKIDQFQDSISVVSSDGNKIYKRKIKREEFDTLLKQFASYTDSISALTEHNPEIRVVLQHLFINPDSLLDYIETNAAFNPGLFIKDLTLNIDLAMSMGLRFCHAKIAGRGTNGGLWLFPSVSVPRGVVRPGERFKAEIFMSCFLEHGIGELQIAVNGNAMPIKDGVAQYSATFSTPGVKTYHVEASVTDPYTKRKRAYNKTFEVLVVEPCPETR